MAGSHQAKQTKKKDAFSFGHFLLGHEAAALAHALGGQKLGIPAIQDDVPSRGLVET